MIRLCPVMYADIRIIDECQSWHRLDTVGATVIAVRPANEI